MGHHAHCRLSETHTAGLFDPRSSITWPNPAQPAFGVGPGVINGKTMTAQPRIGHLCPKLRFRGHQGPRSTEPFRKYNTKTANCRYKFQMDKALEMIRLGIERDWDRSGGNGNEKPAWMRQVNEVACGCQTCCFCTSGDTTGIAHPSTQKKNSKAALSSGHAVSPKHDCTKFDKVERQGDCSLCHLSKKLKFDTADEGASRKKTVGQQEQGGSSVQGVQQADVRRLR